MTNNDSKIYYGERTIKQKKMRGKQKLMIEENDRQTLTNSPKLREMLVILFSLYDDFAVYSLN